MLDLRETDGVTHTGRFSVSNRPGVRCRSIVARVERLHWRIWNGKAKNAHVSIDRIRAVTHVFKNETRGRGASASSGNPWHALHEIDEYLTGQSTWLVNYAERYRAGLRVGTSITEGTANFLMNRRTNKQRQIRWSRRGADAVLQVRCAIYNGTLGTEFGHLFNPESDVAFVAIAFISILARRLKRLVTEDVRT